MWALTSWLTGGVIDVSPFEQRASLCDINSYYFCRTDVHRDPADRLILSHWSQVNDLCKHEGQTGIIIKCYYYLSKETKKKSNKTIRLV